MTPEEQLVALYQQAAKRLRAQAGIAIQSGNLATAAYRQQQLLIVQGILRKLGRRSRALESVAIRDAYGRAAEAVDTVLSIEGGAGFAFAGPHQEAVRVLAHNLAVKLGDARNLVGRRAEDAYRRIALQEVAVAAAAGDTRREASKAIAQRLIREGVTDATTGFVNRRGARIPLDTYTRMVARTTTSEAVNAATANRILDSGQPPLITISNHATTTEICIPYEGQTFALPGQTVPGYKTIDRLPPFHPNCEHHATPAAGSAEAFLRLLETRA